MPAGENVSSLWLNDRDIVVIHHVEIGGVMSAVRCAAEVRHLDSGATEAVPQFHETVPPFGGFYLTPTERLTPDRRAIRFWNAREIGCVPVAGHSGAPTTHVWAKCYPRTNDPFIHAVDSDRGVSLLPSDPSHWVFCDAFAGPGMNMYFVGNDRGEVSSTKAFSLPQQFCEIGATFSQLGLTPNGHVLIAAGPAIFRRKPTPCAIFEYRAGSPISLRTYPVHLPISNVNKIQTANLSVECALSPDGSKIAWLLPYWQKRAASPLILLLRRWHVMPSVPDHALWVSNRTGGSMRMIRTWSADGGRLSRLDWTPNGRFITFEQDTVCGPHGEHDAILYKIPAGK